MNTIDVIESQDAPAKGSQQRALAPATNPSELLSIAVTQGASLDQLERLMALQERWEANEARKAFVAAMSAFKAEPMTIFKRKRVGYETRDGEFVGYSHAELSDITDVVGPAMGRHGLSYRWDIQQRDGRVHITCIVTHANGHSESVTMDAPPDNSGKKNTIQQIASATTYLQRYTLLAATGMSTKGMDDDGQGAGGDDSPPPPPQPETYPPERFEANLPEWTGLIHSGRKTPDALIAVLSTKWPLTEQQKATLRALKRER